MGVWLQTLMEGAQGRSQEAIRILEVELPLTLRRPEFTIARGQEYEGPLASAAARFIVSLPESERRMARSRLYDFIDYVLDKIRAKITRTVLLIAYCREYPEQTIVEIVDSFPDWAGFNRSFEEKVAWVRRHLAAMAELGVPVPPAIRDQIHDETDPVLEFNEIALAVGWNFAYAWNDFKEQMELDYHYTCITESDNPVNPGPDGEAMDYGLISMSEVVLGGPEPPDPATIVDLHHIGEMLGPELTTLMEEQHNRRPADGYRPIAWHNVFWEIPSKFEAIPIQLDTREPLCDTDQVLADHLAAKYQDVRKPNRLKVQRRRKSLYDACEHKVINSVRAWMNKLDGRSHDPS
jgi:hypothetical protein